MHSTLLSGGGAAVWNLDIRKIKDVLLSMAQERSLASAGSQLQLSGVDCFPLSTSWRRHPLGVFSWGSQCWGTREGAGPGTLCSAVKQNGLCRKSLPEQHVLGAGAEAVAACGFSFGLAWWKPTAQLGSFLLRRKSSCVALLQEPELVTRHREVLQWVLHSQDCWVSWYKEYLDMGKEV